VVYLGSLLKLLQQKDDEEIHMAENKGKPSGKFAESKKSPGRKGDYKRSGWPEDAPTQRVADATGRQTPRTAKAADTNGRDRKAGSPR
jgi:hypothetical protein